MPDPILNPSVPCCTSKAKGCGCATLECCGTRGTSKGKAGKRRPTDGGVTNLTPSSTDGRLFTTSTPPAAPELWA